MSISKVEFRMFSGPAQVDLGGLDRPTIVDLRFGPKGDKGDDGTNGNAATVTVGTTTTGAAGSSASVTNSGTTSAAVFNFAIPRGDTGATGATGPNSVTSATSSDGTAAMTFASVGSPIIKATTSAGVSAKTNGGTECFSWGAGNGQNFTFTAGTGIAFNATSYTFGSGAASAFKSSLAIATADITDATTTGEANKLAKVNASGNLVCASLGISNQATSSSTFFIQPITGLEASIYVPINNGTLALTSASSGEPDKLTGGTISGTLAINSTSYTYGTGAAAAHVTALGLPTTGDIVTLTGAQTLTNKTLTTPTIAQINGSTTASGSLTLSSTTHATKGKIIFGTASAYDQVNDRFAIGTTTPSYPMEVVRSTASTADADIPQILLHNLNTSSTAFAIMRVKIGTGYTGGYPDIFIQASGGTGGVVSIRGVSNHAMRFLTNDTARMTIANTGEVGIGTTSPSTKAVLDLTSTAKGFLPPRMTTAQRDAITSVPAGLMIYNTTTNKLNVFTTTWEQVTSA